MSTAVCAGVGLPAERFAAATLACLPDMGPARLRRVLEHWGQPGAALDAVRRGRGHAALADDDPPRSAAARQRLGRRWSDAARQLAIESVLRARGTGVLLAGDPGYPIREPLPDLPPLLLQEGDAPEVFDRPRVAVVGTRSASAHGLHDARTLGAFLGDCGITVVSGMAIGVDAAAHEGALEAGGGVVGVVATGLDVVYPRRHVRLFDQVRRAGVLVTESGFGVQAERWRFPVRNRIIAAIADVVVVVEATLKGGARITADRALEYDRPVLAVPGSRRNPSAEGCNALLADGAHPLLQPEDVLLALGLTPGSRRGWGAPAGRIKPAGSAAHVLRACAGEPASVDQLASRTELGLEEVMLALRELQRQGWIESRRGWWWPQ